MSGSARRLIVVLAAVALLAIVFVLVRPGGDTPAGTPGTPSNPAGRAAGAGAIDEGDTDVKLEALHAKRETLTEAARNPFRFEARTPPPPPERPRDERPSLPDVFTPPVQTGPPPPPPIPLRYIGFVAAQGGVRTATFSDGRGHVVQGREGDIIEGRYKVLRVGTDSVELAYLDGRGRQTIRLSGQ